MSCYGKVQLEAKNMQRLQGKHVLITGASQGFGRQLAIDFAREGAAGIKGSASAPP